MKTMSEFTKNKYNMYLRKCNFDGVIIKENLSKSHPYEKVIHYTFFTWSYRPGIYVNRNSSHSSRNNLKQKKHWDVKTNFYICYEKYYVPPGKGKDYVVTRE